MVETKVMGTEAIANALEFFLKDNDLEGFGIVAVNKRGKKILFADSYGFHNSTIHYVGVLEVITIDMANAFKENMKTDKDLETAMNDLASATMYFKKVSGLSKYIPKEVDTKAIEDVR